MRSQSQGHGCVFTNASPASEKRAVPERPATAADIVDGDSLSPVAPYRVVNIGNSDKVKLLDFIEASTRGILR